MCRLEGDVETLKSNFSLFSRSIRNHMPNRSLRSSLPPSPFPLSIFLLSSQPPSPFLPPSLLSPALPPQAMQSPSRATALTVIDGRGPSPLSPSQACQHSLSPHRTAGQRKPPLPAWRRRRRRRGGGAADWSFMYACACTLTVSVCVRACKRARLPCVCVCAQACRLMRARAHTACVCVCARLLVPSVGARCGAHLA